MDFIKRLGFKELFFIAPFYLSLLLLGASSASAVDYRVNAGSTVSGYSFRVFYTIPSKTYTGYSSSGTFQCGGTFNYGLELWTVAPFPVADRKMIYDVCGNVGNFLNYTCSAKPCGWFSIASYWWLGDSSCSAYQYNDSNIAEISNGTFLMWSPHVAIADIDFDGDGFSYSQNDCVSCNPEFYPGASEPCCPSPWVGCALLPDYACNGIATACVEIPFTPLSGALGFGNKEHGTYQFKNGQKGRGMGGYEIFHSN